MEPETKDATDTAIMAL
jgi:hypothetical protein